MKKNLCCAVIVAAGSSTRMGKEKQWIDLCGKSVLERTTLAFQNSKTISSIVLVCPKLQQEKYYNKLKNIINKPFKVVEGGKTRQQSAFIGVKNTENTEYVAIHDGARALIIPEEIDAVVKDAIKYKYSTAAVPVKNTIKIADNNNMVLTTPKRSDLWEIQTPQVFLRNIYTDLMNNTNEDYTDDCQLFENNGYKIHLCKTSYNNFKLTTPEDIVFANAVLKLREKI